VSFAQELMQTSIRNNVWKVAISVAMIVYNKITLSTVLNVLTNAATTLN